MNAGNSSNTGLVLDVLRGSVHDGPGIRTTVFLKGCPLRCIWCHNPESQRKAVELSFNAGRCTFCGACQRVCPQGVHLVEAGGHKIDRTACKQCGACIQACSVGALELKGRVVSVDEVMREVVADRAYYAATGGGMTLSGGEPMAQYAFSRALLQEAKRHGVHTAMETCGFAPAWQYEAIASLVDLFLFDCKGVDDVLHREHTGVSNKTILSNFELLNGLKGSIILRCPLVVGLNDSDEAIRGIIELERQYPNLKGIEVMAYHRMGNEKGLRVGMEIPFDQESTTQQQKEEWARRFNALGARHILIQ